MGEGLVDVLDNRFNYVKPYRVFATQTYQGSSTGSDPRRVDYIYVSKGMQEFVHRAEIISSEVVRQASNHLPVVLDLRVDSVYNLEAASPRSPATSTIFKPRLVKSDGKAGRPSSDKKQRLFRSP